MKTFLFFLLLLMVIEADAQQWVGTTSTDWNTAGNWNPATIPTAGSNVTFDVASPPFNCILNTAVAIIQFSQSNGVFSMAAGGSLTVNGTFTVSGGTFNAGSGILSVPNNTFTLSGGLFNGGSSMINIGANIQVGNPAFFTKGTSTLVFNGTSEQNLNITYVTNPHITPIYKLILNKPGTILRFNGANTDSVEVEDSIILINGQFQGSKILKAEKNIWVQPGFDGSGIPIAFTGNNNSVARLDTTFASLTGSNVFILKSNPSVTVSFIRTNPTDTVRLGNFNADLTITRGILQFPDNPPVICRYRNIIIPPAGTLLSTSNYLYNGGGHTNTGGTFLHNNGTYVFNQSVIPSTTQFTNHIENFNNLIIDLAGTQFNASANDTLIVNGNLTLRGGLITGGSLSAFNIKGNLIFETGMDPTQTNTKLVFTGTVDQSIGFAAGREGYWNASITVNKPTGLVILNSPLTLDESNQVFTFTQGIVTIPDTTNNYIYFTNNYSVTGAGAASYVDGPVRVKRWTNDPFEFPIGNSGFYGPIRISDFWASGEDIIFSGQYIHEPSQYAAMGTKEPPIVNISTTEWWQIKRVSGPITSPPYLWLSFDNLRSGGVTDPGKLRVSRWDALTSVWQDRGNGAMSGNFIRATQAVAQFSPFTLGSTDPVANPLPVHLISFTATPKNNHNLLQWTVVNEQNLDKYIIESSKDGLYFSSIDSVKGYNSSLEINYAFHDTTLAAKTFYRLKMLDMDGRFNYSKIVVVNKQGRGFAANVFPNPGSRSFAINIIAEASSPANVSISDMNGKILFKKDIFIKKGVNYYTYYVPQLTQGNCFIIINTEKGESEVLKYMVTK